MAFPERFLDELVARSDITDVVSSYVQLTKRSGSNLFGLCPFHSEKTPSFSVSPDKQIYHCFGCGKGGGVISFIMEIENLSFPDAVRFLARRAGMEVPEDGEEEGTRNRRARMLELNRQAARFFYDNLSMPEGAAALEYINKRQISREMVVRFGLGFAPDSWTALADAMGKKGFTPGELLDAGLTKRSQRGGGGYDAFRNRLMFPVIDVRGSVIGFSGRILGDGEPKYLNSPDTLVFSKSRNLFALNLAKKSKRGMLILAEGNVDVVSLHQAGFDCAVASLGTSLTPEQARLMARYTNQVVISYDADEAGVKASQRAIGILEKAGLAVRVLTVTGAKDPDEFIKAKGTDAFELLLEKSEDRIDYQLLKVKSKFDVTTDQGRLSYFSEACGILAAIENAVEREIYSAKVAETAGVSAEAVKNEVRKAFKRRIAAQNKKQARMDLHPAAAVQPREKSIRYDNVSSAMAEEGVVRLLMLDPTLLDEAQGLKEEEFTSPFLGKTFHLIRERTLGGLPVSPALLASSLEPDEVSRLTEILQKPATVARGAAAMHDYIDKIRTERLKTNPGGNLLEVQKRMLEKKGYGG